MRDEIRGQVIKPITPQPIDSYVQTAEEQTEGVVVKTNDKTSNKIHKAYRWLLNEALISFTQRLHHASALVRRVNHQAVAWR